MPARHPTGQVPGPVRGRSTVQGSGTVCTHCVVSGTGDAAAGRANGARHDTPALVPTEAAAQDALTPGRPAPNMRPSRAPDPHRRTLPAPARRTREARPPLFHRRTAVSLRLAPLACALLLAACGGGSGDAADGEGGRQSVNVYNWSDYVAEDTIEGFEQIG